MENESARPLSSLKDGCDQLRATLGERVRLDGIRSSVHVMVEVARGADDDDIKGAGAVDPFDSLEFNV
jgi:hypothetical protein